MSRNERRLARKSTRAAEGIEALAAAAMQHHAAGELEKAEAFYRKVLALRPGWPEAINNFAAVLQAQGKLDEALAQYTHAHALIPDSAKILYNIGNVFKEQDKLAEAMTHYEKALALDPQAAEIHNNMGVAFKQMERLDEAQAQYEKSLALRPDAPETHNNLANVLKEQGKFTEAIAHYDRAIALLPEYAQAHYNRCELVTFSRDETAVLEALAASPSMPPDRKPYIHFALAKAYEDLSEHARAFEQLRTGNALKRRFVHYDEAATQAGFRRIRQTFGAELLHQLAGSGAPSSAPIFIIGMPRCGSTLVEQILASHPQVHGAGELDLLHRIAHSRMPAYPAYLQNIRPDDLRALGANYLAGLPPLPAGKTHVTDKRLLNFLHVGLIRLILPGARIVHVQREAADNCVSCFSKLFTGNNVPFSYDLAELGRYWRLYDDLMQHWRSVLPASAMLEIRYEDVVDDLEAQARRLLEYCGLPWDVRCLRFYETRRAVTTASTVQVRKPLFRSSLNRWQRDAQFLQPLLAELKR